MSGLKIAGVLLSFVIFAVSCSLTGVFFSSEKLKYRILGGFFACLTLVLIGLIVWILKNENRGISEIPEIEMDTEFDDAGSAGSHN
jgi:hypothetical protein